MVADPKYIREISGVKYNLNFGNKMKLKEKDKAQIKS